MKELMLIMFLLMLMGMYGAYNLGVQHGKAQIIKKEPKIIEARVEAKGNINDLLSDMRIYHHN